MIKYTGLPLIHALSIEGMLCPSTSLSPNSFIHFFNPVSQGDCSLSLHPLGERVVLFLENPTIPTVLLTHSYTRIFLCL